MLINVRWREKLIKTIFAFKVLDHVKNYISLKTKTEKKKEGRKERCLLSDGWMDGWMDGWRVPKKYYVCVCVRGQKRNYHYQFKKKYIHWLVCAQNQPRDSQIHIWSVDLPTLS